MAVTKQIYCVEQSMDAPCKTSVASKEYSKVAKVRKTDQADLQECERLAQDVAEALICSFLNTFEAN